jgi:hypothetical protein
MTPGLKQHRLSYKNDLPYIAEALIACGMSYKPISQHLGHYFQEILSETLDLRNGQFLTDPTQPQVLQKVE